VEIQFRSKCTQKYGANERKCGANSEDIQLHGKVHECLLMLTWLESTRVSWSLRCR